MQSVRSIYYNMYQEENPEQFNEELINYKSKEDILYFIDAVGKGLEIIQNIEYKGSYIEPIRNVYKNTKKEVEIEIETSLLEKIVMEFHISKKDSDDDETEMDIKLEQYFPILKDNQFFIINGNRYTPIYQLVDSFTYRTKKFLVFKNLIMHIMVEDDADPKKAKEDIEGNIYKNRILYLYLFKAKVNVFVYFFAKKGYEETLRFFGLEDYVHMIDLSNGEDFIEGYNNFKVSNSLGFSIEPEFMEDSNNEIIILTLLNNFTNRIKADKVLDKEYWLKQLGSNFTKNNSVHAEKGANILLSFERSLDNVTKKVIRIPEEEKEDIYCIVRHLCQNCVKLSKLDNMDLANKRLRLYEFLVYPLLRKFSKGIYRLINKKSPSIKEIKSIFNIPKGFLVSSLVKTETIRYVNLVNSYELFNVALKGTLSGPQSQFNGKSDNIKYRRLHPSYMQKIDLVSTSAGDPGCSFVLVPFLKMEENLHFTKSYNYENNDEIIDEDDYE